MSSLVGLHVINHLRNSFARIVTRRRLQKDWTQENMAAYNGLKHSYASRFEKGLRTPSHDVVFRFAKAFKISPQTLVKEVKSHLE